MKMLRWITAVLVLLCLAPLAWGSPAELGPDDLGSLWLGLMDGAQHVLDSVLDLFATETTVDDSDPVSQSAETDDEPAPELWTTVEPFG